MKKWQAMLIALLLIGLVAAVFGALPDGRPARTQKPAGRWAQLGTCAANLTVRGGIDNFDDSAEPSTTPRATGAIYPYEKYAAGTFAAGSRYADYQGVFTGQLDVLTLEIVRREDCSGQQPSPGKGRGRNEHDVVIRVAAFGGLDARN